MQTLPPNVQPRRLHASIFVALVAAVICTCSLLLAATASATDYTWKGGGSSSDWSEATNWLGGSAPTMGATIETLTLPLLSGGLQNINNNVSGLSVRELQVEASHGYGVSGEALTLGSGGLSMSTAERSSGGLFLGVPLTLSGNQEWKVAGPAPESGVHVITPDLTIENNLAGESSNLTINLTGEAFLQFGLGVPHAPHFDDEVGNVTINGEAGDGGVVRLTNADLNATDHHSITLNHVSWESAEGTATGPIVATDSQLDLEGSSIGSVTARQSLLETQGILPLPSLSLDEGSTLRLYMATHGNTLGTDYTQITSTGQVSLGGATLDIIGPGPGTECPSPTVGETDTLISTTGSLEGAFGNYPNDSALLIPCFDGQHEVIPGEEPAARVYLYRINYNTTSSPEIVTATTLPGVPVSYEPPTIAGTPTSGQTLSESSPTWYNSPTGYTYQWQRCDSEGNNCQDIVGATGQTYTLTTADVGSTIRVQQTATNNEGTSTPEVSAPTAVVQVAPAGGGGSTNGSTSSGGSTSGGSSTGSSSGGNTTATISSAQIAALLTSQLIPSGKAATIPALLKSGGLTMNFTALEAGTASVSWYEVPAGAKLAKKRKAKPVLVASGQISFSAAGTGKIKVGLTAAGKRLLKHAKSFKVTAKGAFTTADKAPVSVTKTVLLRR